MKIDNKGKAELTKLGAVFACANIVAYLIFRPEDAAWLYPAPAFLLVAVLWPRWLAPLDFVWRKFGQALGRVMEWVMLSLIFFLLLTPLALLRRCFGGGGLDLEISKKAETYWKERKSETFDAEYFKRQF